VQGCNPIKPCKLAAQFGFFIDSCLVKFADFSAVGVGTTLTGWYWDFGDGNTSAQVNPTHIFTQAGSYVISVTVTSTYGCSSSSKTTFDAAMDALRAQYPAPAKPAVDPAMKTAVEALIAKRKTAVETAQATFKTTMEAARAELAKVIPVKK
jgi:hypothetical protein